MKYYKIKEKKQIEKKNFIQFQKIKSYVPVLNKKLNFLIFNSLLKKQSHECNN